MMPSIAVTLMILAFVSLVNAQLSWDTYANSKTQLKFVKYSAAERRLLINQAIEMMHIYVNKDVKVERYTEQVDPIPRLQQLLTRADTISDAELHKQMASIFLNLRDLHTSYMMPGPFGCFRLVWPLEFTLAASKNVNDPAVVVRSFAASPVYEKLDIKSTVSIGDRLMAYNNKNFTTLFQQYNAVTAGSNPYGGQRSLLNFLSFVNARTTIPDDETQVTYTLQRPNGSVYTVTYPVTTKASKRCVESNGLFGLGPGGYRPITHQDRKKIAKEQLYNMINTNIEEMNNIFARSTSGKLKSAQDPLIKWTIIKDRDFQLGIIRLSSFKIDMLNVDKSVMILRDLLTKELKDTDGLVFDVRDNGGGQIIFAESIAQLFAFNVEPSGARLVNHPTNKKIFSSEAYLNSPWANRFRDVKPTDRYTRPAHFVTKAAVNHFGMVYMKPVAVLTNANCYSSCDLFAAQMQDQANALIFGEDPQTGGGGANVVEHKAYFSTVLPSVFVPLPGYQDIRLGWRQVVRTGSREGQLIEEDGVFADVVIRPSIDDIIKNNPYGQAPRMIQYLKEYGGQTGKRHLYFAAEPQTDSTLTVGDNLDFKGELAWMTRLDLVRNNVTLDTRTFPQQKERTAFQLSSVQAIRDLAYDVFVIRGYVHDKQVLETYRYVKIAPHVSQFHLLKPGTSYDWDFKVSSFIGLYNKINIPQDGWLLKGKSAVLGDGVSYAENVDSTFAFFLNIPQNVNSVLVNMKGWYETEESYDYFRVLVVLPDMTPTIIYEATGASDMDVELDLTEYRGCPDLELRFTFLSDGAVSGKGVTLTALSIVTA